MPPLLLQPVFTLSSIQNTSLNPQDHHLHFHPLFHPLLHPSYILTLSACDQVLSPTQIYFFLLIYKNNNYSCLYVLCDSNNNVDNHCTDLASPAINMSSNGDTQRGRGFMIAVILICLRS